MAVWKVGGREEGPYKREKHKYMFGKGVIYEEKCQMFFEWGGGSGMFLF